MKKYLLVNSHTNRQQPNSGVGDLYIICKLNRCHLSPRWTTIYPRDKNGRLLYHVDLHPNDGKKWTFEEEEYIVKFHDRDDIEFLSLALGRTTYSITQRLVVIKRGGRYDGLKQCEINYVRGARSC